MAIFSDDNLWDDPVFSIGARLGLSKESETPLDSVFRSYPGEFSTLFGGKLKSIQLVEAGAVLATARHFGDL